MALTELQEHMLRRHIATQVSLVRGSLLTEDASANDIDEVLIVALWDAVYEAQKNLIERIVRAEVAST